MNEPNPKTDENPQSTDVRLRRLHALHRHIGRLIILHEASAKPRIVIDGDIELAWPESVRQEIEDRISQQMKKTSALIQELKDDGENVGRNRRQ